MKKSILAIGAAAVVGGLGFAGSAQAVAVFGDVGASPRPGVNAATLLLQSPNGIGHHLFTPYFSAQGTMGTLFNITNTDRTNGKAVKVRFRGAANSDDVLDFTVFLSPGDVWTGSVTQDTATGHAVVSTPDNSCTIPVKSDWPGVFKTNRLAPYLSAEVAAANTREGYIEVLNMADIPPSTVTGSLYKGIKHVNGVAPCDAIPYDDVLSTTVVSASEASLHGLAAPSGGLMGSWAVFNQDQLAVYSGNQTALTAASTNFVGNTLTPVSGYGLIAFAPQVEEAIGNQALVDALTADPLLRTGTSSGITPLWYDLPDMSTPYIVGNNAVQQAIDLSEALSKSTVYNDYVATAAGASVPMETDWVVSQPTRRYHAAVAYGTAASGSKIEWTTTTGSSATAPTGNPYSALTINRSLAQGPQACLSAAFSSADREEKFQTLGGGFSPGVTSPYCGEVFTISFSSAASVLQASLTNRVVAPVGDAGWARLQLANSVYAPIVGFAATSIRNQATGGNFGLTLPHRWDGASVRGTP